MNSITQPGMTVYAPEGEKGSGQYFEKLKNPLAKGEALHTLTLKHFSERASLALAQAHCTTPVVVEVGYE